jgi:hypothetical protein
MYSLTILDLPLFLPPSSQEYPYLGMLTLGIQQNTTVTTAQKGTARRWTAQRGTAQQTTIGRTIQEALHRQIISFHYILNYILCWKDGYNPAVVANHVDRPE